MSIPAPETPARPIEHPRELSTLVAELRDAPRLALDVEGDGFYRYRSRLCALQLATPERVAVIDTLAIDDLSALAPLLGPGGPTKVLHDASFDARMLLRRGVPLAPVLDTSIAARFLGESATGLASVLSRHLGITLAKEQQQADWGVRPITDEQLAYLVADVLHLIPLAEILEARLREADLLEEVEEEGRYVLARALEPEPAREPWTRIKGARELEPRSLALLAALCEVREQEAEARDVPPFRVAANAALFEAARRGAADVRGLRRIRGLRELDDARLEEALSLATTRGPPRDPESVAPPPEDRARRRAREKALVEWRAREAERRSVNEQAVLPGHCLRELATITVGEGADLAAIAGFGEKRLARYGDELVRLLASL